MSELRHAFERPGNGTIISIYSDYETKFLSGKKDVTLLLNFEELLRLFNNDEFKNKLEHDLTFFEYALMLFIKSIDSIVKSQTKNLLLILRSIRKQQKDTPSVSTYDLVLGSYKFFLLKKPS